jgi:hypothetical protein
MAVVGALMLAADKGALCLTMSALDSLPKAEFAAMMPGLMAMFSKEGWLVLLWGLLLLPVGFAVQAVALLRSGAIPRWQGLLFLIGVLFVGTPDGVEIVNLTAACLLAIAFVRVRAVRDAPHPTGAGEVALAGWVGGEPAARLRRTLHGSIVARSRRTDPWNTRRR